MIVIKRRIGIYYQKDGPCKIIDYLSNDKLRGHKHVMVKFTLTGYVTTVTLRQVKNGEVKDYYRKSFCGVGFLGDDYKSIRPSKLHDRAHNIWSGMIQRCYYPNFKAYSNYGAIGIKVCSRWLNYSNFFKDMTELQGWDEKSFLNREISLDKDILHNGNEVKKYSPSTCCWANIYEQNNNTSYVVNKFKAITPSGDIILNDTLSLSAFATEYSLTPHHIGNCLRGTASTHKGWKFEKL
jgi:hypothetical protein